MQAARPGASLLRRWRLATGACSRGFADQPAVAVGINIRKGGSDPPLRPDDEYPDWLARLGTPQQSLYELQRRIEAAGSDSLSLEEASRYVKLDNRASVRERNSLRSKK